MQRLHLLLQYLLPHRLLSRFMGYLANTKIKWIKNLFIKVILTLFDVNLEESEHSNPYTYTSFNAFFTRHLKPGMRPMDASHNTVVSPADGAISQLGAITQGRLIQAKGHEYQLKDLLAGNEQRVSDFDEGQFITIYLAPKDYHRVHMPFAGELREMVYVPGKLFSVNQNTANNIDNLFARNERVICYFQTDMGPMAVILVGAMIVASIYTSWHGCVAPHRPRQLQTWTYSSGMLLEKGQEMGHFQMGSTAIVLTPKGMTSWEEHLAPQAPVTLGKSIGQVNLDLTP